MEAKELRHNNLVLDRAEKKLRIDWLEKDKVCMKMELMGKEVHPLTEYFEYLKPISLTEEILLKCGFENIVDGNFWDKNICIHVSKDELYILTEQRRVYVKYLHQLQNLYFALTDQELDVSKII